MQIGMPRSNAERRTTTPLERRPLGYGPAESPRGYAHTVPLGFDGCGGWNLNSDLWVMRETPAIGHHMR